MQFIHQKEREPNKDDLPFVTYDPKRHSYELWEDSDWFFELTESERAERPWFMPLGLP